MTSHLLEILSRFTLELISAWGYWGVFLVMALENIFPPIPSEVVMPFAGFLVSTGRFNLIWTIVLGTLGALAGAIPYYLLGYFLGGARMRHLLNRYGKYFLVGEKDLNRAEKWFNRYQERSVFLARLIPLARTFISVPAGFVKMGPVKFVLYTGLGTLIWTAFLTLIGFFLGENWDIVGPYFEKMDYFFLVIFTSLFLFYAYKKARSLKQAS